MAHSNQSRKRVRQNEKHRLRNKAVKSALRTFLKKTQVAVEQRKLDDARKLLPLAMKKLDKAAKTRTIHPNTASRNKASLARKVAQLEKELAGTPAE
ncbi:MAG: 30S ribosomal protein S20 [Planctomycetes bacterium]|nr:30S ribosomal protein S20 [Planctomycetota bacterium]